MGDKNIIRRVEDDSNVEYRSATQTVERSGDCRSLVAPYVHEVIDEARNAKDDEPHVIIPPGTSHPEK